MDHGRRGEGLDGHRWRSANVILTGIGTVLAG